MNIIAFDTSNNDNISVAISNGKNVLSYLTDHRQAKQAEMLIPMIEEAIKRAAISYEQINYLGVSSGPGSFTGIRIGLAAAKSIAFGTGIEAMAISNFDIAFNYVKTKITNYDNIMVVINAYRGQFYVQQFDKNSSLAAPEILSNLELINMFNNIKHKIVCIGKDLGPLYNDLNIMPNVTILPRFPRMNALYMCHIIRDIIEECNDKRSLLEPLYIRLPDAIPNIAK
ncbi:MAG: tRNA (adenosine(37)-N6)-threonylcarbamoyltransferase complex dimerization subunit type 1 TsaB [Rickettsiaceae bacterium]|nr:MAG: tRNA (adenosine(37)-N6)-threonylcarbamoyltransferase complex dimerization subunit type 1 TsaB [Rickettsiaceae bacterium]